MESTLQHKKLTLQLTNLDECEMLFPIFSNEEMVRYTNFKKFDDLNLFREFMGRFLKIGLDEPVQYGPYSIYLNDSIIGLCGAQQIDKEAGTSELWYILHKNYWGKGLAKKAVQLILDKSKSNPDLKSLYAEALNINPASWKILEHFRFVKTKEIKNGFNKGEFHADLSCYSYSCAS